MLIAKLVVEYEIGRIEVYPCFHIGTDDEPYRSLEETEGTAGLARVRRVFKWYEYKHDGNGMRLPFTSGVPVYSDGT